MQIVGRAMPSLLVVKVADESGVGIAGYEIYWRSVEDPSRQVTSRTNDSGNAGILWSLSNSAGVQKITVTALGSDARATFSMTALPDRPFTAQFVQDTLRFHALGDSASFRPIVADRHGNVINEAALVWGTDDSLAVRIDANGTMIAADTGDAQITATSEGATARLVAIVRQVASRIDLPFDTLRYSAIGDTICLTADVLDRNGNTVKGASVSWTVTDTVLAVSAAGCVISKHAGIAAVRATSGGITRDRPVKVDPHPSWISVTPASDTITAIGDTVRLQAVATDRNSSGIVQVPTWRSLDSLSSVTSSGLVTAHYAGTTRVEARLGAVADTAQLLIAQVLAGLQVSPPRDTVLAGDTISFTAHAVDRNGHAIFGQPITWVSQDVSRATVDSLGRVVGRRVGSINITVAAGPYGRVVQVVVKPGSTVAISLAGARDSMFVSETASLSIRGTDVFGNLTDSIVNSVLWLSSDTAVIRVGQSGYVRAVGPGSAVISAQALGLDVQDTVSVASSVLDSLAIITGHVQLPSTVDTSALFISAGAGIVSSVASDGSFSISASGEVASTAVAMVAGQLVAMTIVPPISALPSRFSNLSSGLAMSAATTAEAMVFLNPVTAGAPRAITAELLQMIRSTPAVQSLASYLEESLSRSGVLPSLFDPEFVRRYQTAVADFHQRLAAMAPAPSVASIVEMKGSGLRVTVSGEGSRSVDATIANSGGRFVSLYVVPADDQGRPVDNVSSVSSALSYKVRTLPPADWIPDVTDVLGWLRFLRSGQLVERPAHQLVLPLSEGSSRFLIQAYGLGTRDLAAELSEMREFELVRLLSPAVLDAFFSVLLPAIEVGLDMDLAAALDNAAEVEQLLGLVLSGQDLSLCLGGQQTTLEIMNCFVGFALDAVIADEELIEELVMIVVRAAGRQISQNALSNVATKLLVGFKIARLVGSAIDLGVTLATIANAEVREEFDVSYNGLLGASDIHVSSGDGQQGDFEQALANPIRVRISDSSGNPVTGAWVGWVPLTGGAVPAAYSITDGSGVASTQWTLGPTATDQSMRAVILGTTRSVIIRATAQILGSGPLRLRAPWDDGQFWVPQTYDNHMPGAVPAGMAPDFQNSARFAVDFYFAQPQGPGALSWHAESGRGRNVRAMLGGVVSWIRDQQCNSTFVRVTSPGNIKIDYIHLIPRSVVRDQSIAAGEVIGSVSDEGIEATGESCARSGPHLMIYIKRGGALVPLDAPDEVLIDGEVVFAGVRDVSGSAPNVVYKFGAMPRSAIVASPTGTLMLSPSSCTIAAGASSCNVTISWSTTNPVGTSEVTSNWPNAGFVVANANSGSQSVSVPHGGRQFFLYNNFTELQARTANASCVSGTTWNGSSCATVQPTGTLTLTPSSCTIAAGASSCNISISWSTTNPVGTSEVTSSWPSAGTVLYRANSGTSQPVTVPHGGRQLFLYNNFQELQFKTAGASCVSGSTWNGNTCQAASSSPIVTSISPTSMAASTTLLTTLTVSGSGFSTSGGQLQFTDPSGNIYSSNAHPSRIVSVTSSQWVYRINNGGARGTWQVRVINSNGASSNPRSFVVQ